MSNNSNSNSSRNNSNDHPKNLVQFESQEVKHKFGLSKYPDISTEGLIVSLRNILKRMVMDGTPSSCQLTDIQYMSLEYWAEICVEMLDVRIKALQNRIDK
jgi:hypothetical protein